MPVEFHQALECMIDNLMSAKTGLKFWCTLNLTTSPKRLFVSYVVSAIVVDMQLCFFFILDSCTNAVCGEIDPLNWH